MEQNKTKNRDNLLRKISHAVKTSPQFRSSFSSLVQSTHVANQAPLSSPSTGIRHTSTVDDSRGDTGSSINKTSRSSNTMFTTVPDHDGYQWRKYGEKKIVGSKFPRMYYRCTFQQELNCRATKHVQQCTNDNPPMYKVSYFHEHDCTNINFWETVSSYQNQQMLHFNIKETSTINSPASSASRQQTKDPIEFESMEYDLSFCDQSGMDELLSELVMWD